MTALGRQVVDAQRELDAQIQSPPEGDCPVVGRPGWTWSRLRMVLRLPLVMGARPRRAPVLRVSTSPDARRSSQITLSLMGRPLSDPPPGDGGPGGPPDEVSGDVVGPTSGVPHSTEVAVHELGESLAFSMALAQHELNRHATVGGAFVLDDLDATLAVGFRVDPLGQLMATVTDGEPVGGAGRPVSQLRLRLTAREGVTPPAPSVPAPPVSALPGLTREQITRLESFRIFSVQDLARVLRTPSGRAALRGRLTGVDPDELLERVTLLGQPGLPAAVASALLALKVSSVTDFLKADADRLARRLAPLLDDLTDGAVTEEDVRAWQAAVRASRRVSRPSKRTPDSA
ncbi:hypothetical protein [Geodermatophilus telluris]|nr:hypothetical protein [Geodermatophilus telluris]